MTKAAAAAAPTPLASVCLTLVLAGLVSTQHQAQVDTLEAPEETGGFESFETLEGSETSHFLSSFGQVVSGDSGGHSGSDSVFSGGGGGNLLTNSGTGRDVSSTPLSGKDSGGFLSGKGTSGFNNGRGGGGLATNSGGVSTVIPTSDGAFGIKVEGDSGTVSNSGKRSGGYVRSSRGASGGGGGSVTSGGGRGYVSNGGFVSSGGNSGRGGSGGSVFSGGGGSGGYSSSGGSVFSGGGGSGGSVSSGSGGGSGGYASSGRGIGGFVSSGGGGGRGGRGGGGRGKGEGRFVSGSGSSSGGGGSYGSGSGGGVVNPGGVGGLGVYNTPGIVFPSDYLEFIPGTPGRDYLLLASVPSTGFVCDSIPGYYADTAPEALCQVFHICQLDGRLDSFLCPNGTVFNQQYFVCDWWFNFDCSTAEQYYSLNAQIGQADATSPSGFSGGDFGGSGYGGGSSFGGSGGGDGSIQSPPPRSYGPPGK